MIDDKMISVWMITYNHEKYIRQAIESVLAQDVGYDFELMIFNDASTDRTDLIIRDIILSHPRGHLINYQSYGKNIGLSANYIGSIKECKGKYIAICEGDDYWIDKQKLQKQVDFLEKNPDYVFSFHQGIRINTVLNQYYVYPVNDTTTFDAESFFSMTTIPMASVVFRNQYPLEFIPGHSRLDFLLLCNLLSNGKAYFFKEVMSVYRIHAACFSYNHGTVQDFKIRAVELYKETKIAAFNKEVRAQVAKVYMVHVDYLINAFRGNVSKWELFGYLGRFFLLKAPGRKSWTYYKTVLRSLAR